MRHELKRWQAIPAAIVIAIGLSSCEPAEPGEFDDTTVPPVGETTIPDVGETTTPDVGETTTPDVGDTTP